MAALDRLLARDPLDRLAPFPPEPVDDEDDGCPGDHVDIPPASPFSPDAPSASLISEDSSASETDNGLSANEADNGLCRPRTCDTDDGKGGDSHPRSRASAEDERVPGASASRQAKFPALINLIVPAATILGWGTAPGQAGTWGLTGPQETRDIVQAASLHPRTRWCLTVVNEQGEAIAHACADGRHPWTPRPPGPPPDTGHQAGARDHSGRTQEFLASLGFTPGALEQIARGTCDHRHAEPRYAPSRKLRHLILARAQTCTGPGCGGQSLHADQDHVAPYPQGPTDECNLHTPCRAHHRAKQAPDWQVEMPEPGVLRWTLPNGRTRTTHPTIYDC